MKFKYKNIGISGVAGCGKNTIANIIIKLLQRLELPYRELSIAKNLKEELTEASLNLYGIDSFKCNREEKDLIRPFLVAHGEIKRKMSNGRHWVNKINNELYKGYFKEVLFYVFDSLNFKNKEENYDGREEINK